METNNFSEVYGINRDDFKKALGEAGQRKLTLDFLKMFPGITRINGIRKAKTRMMINALIQGVAENGNHFVTSYGEQFHFFYRGTLIYKWDSVNDVQLSVHAGAYEDTASTRNQRKEIQKAIENFKATVLSV